MRLRRKRRLRRALGPFTTNFSTHSERFSFEKGEALHNFVGRTEHPARPYPGTEKAGKITRAQIREIVQIKKEDINARDEEAAMRIIEGTARSMGIEVVDA